MRKFRCALAVFSIIGGTLVGFSSGIASAASSKAPIVIGMIIDQTGAGSSGVNNTYGVQARIDAQNAMGGVNGHKLQLVVKSDQNTPAGNLTAAQTLVENDNALAVIELSSYTFAAAKYLNQAKVPVLGADNDGPEWGQHPNTNMFSVSGTLQTPYNGKLYSYNSDELKELGVTHLAQVVVNVPAAINAANLGFAEAKTYGISKCLDSVVPIDAVNFTTFALQMKSLGCNGVEILGELDSCIAVATALKQTGLSKVADVCFLGYDQSVLNQPTALAAMQGTYTSAAINVLGKHLTAPTKDFLSRLKKYTSWPGGIPSEDVDWGYESADLTIQGLELAGPNPTRASFISNLRKDSTYTAGGLIPEPGINYTHFGTAASLAKTSCSQVLELVGHSFIPAPALHGKLACGKLVALPASG